MSRDMQHCARCLPKVLSEAIGYIPVPEMTNVGGARVDERRILLCKDHYFEAKKSCYYVVPFDRDDDPKDDFLARIARKHNLLRGNSKLKFNGDSSNGDDDLGPSLVDIRPRRIVRNSRKTNKKARIHSREGNATTCGLPVASVDSTTEVEFMTCQNCLTILNRKALVEESISV